VALLMFAWIAWASSDLITTCVSGVPRCTDHRHWHWTTAMSLAVAGGLLAFVSTLGWSRRGGWPWLATAALALGIGASSYALAG
jgi:hypothetical protein